MFTILFAFMFVTAYAAEELPSYIHVCGLKDPNYDQCIINSSNKVLSVLCTTGLPEFNVTALDPVIFDKITFYNTNDLKLNLEDVKITGVCNVDIKSIHLSPDKLHMKVIAALTHIKLSAMYNFAMHLLVSVVDNGRVHIDLTDNITVTLITDFKNVTKNGKTHLYISKVKTILDIKGYNYEFDDSNKNFVELHKAITTFVNENQKDIIMLIKPIMEERLSRLFMSIFDSITHDRFEQMFPDETP